MTTVVTRRPWFRPAGTPQQRRETGTVIRAASPWQWHPNAGSKAERCADKRQRTGRTPGRDKRQKRAHRRLPGCGRSHCRGQSGWLARKGASPRNFDLPSGRSPHPPARRGFRNLPAFHHGPFNATLDGLMMQPKRLAHRKKRRVLLQRRTRAHQLAARLQLVETPERGDHLLAHLVAVAGGSRRSADRRARPRSCGGSTRHRLRM